jgi:tetrapyrrole methylase family protein/MazG family protein
LCEELGDLLLQIVMHAQIAVDEGEFSMADVIAAIDAKIKRRHPHVWGDVHVDSSEDVLPLWEALKAQERSANHSAGAAEASLLDGLPRTLPALAQADAYGRRAARVGFYSPSEQEVVQKIGEEIQDLLNAESFEARSAELGDLLFAVVNWARWLDIDPEAALRSANQRFAGRFAWLESETRRQGLDLADLTVGQMEQLWQAAKSHADD